MWNKNLHKCYLFIIYNLQIHFWLLCSLDVLAAGWPDYGFIINKQVAFLKKKIPQQLMFYLDTMSNVTDCDPGQTNLWEKLSIFFVPDFIKNLTLHWWAWPLRLLLKIWFPAVKVWRTKKKAGDFRFYHQIRTWFFIGFRFTSWNNIIAW